MKRIIYYRITLFHGLKVRFILGRHDARSRNAQRQDRKFETNIPRKGIGRPQSYFHIHMSVSDLQIPRIGLPILLQSATQFLFREYINGIFVAVRLPPCVEPL
jgi:hypothetical protein